jgi:hypothetical protein
MIVHQFEKKRLTIYWTNGDETSFNTFENKFIEEVFDDDCPYLRIETDDGNIHYANLDHFRLITITKAQDEDKSVKQEEVLPNAP